MKFGNIDVSDRIITKTNHAFAFPAKMPILPGHILVCPCRSVDTLENLSPEEQIGLLQLVSEIKESLKSTFNATGFNVAWNEGSVAGQTVPHLHVHIVPRSENDKGIVEYEPRQFLYRPGIRQAAPSQELQEIAQLVSQSFCTSEHSHNSDQKTQDLHPKPIVGALIVNENNEVLLVKQAKWNNKYCIPGGHVEHNETIKDALKREVKEEVGLDIEVIQLLGIQDNINSPDFHQKKHFIFLDHLCRAKHTNVTLDNREAQEFLWTTPENACNLNLHEGTRKVIHQLLNLLQTA